MIFRTGAAANKINGRLAKSIQEVGFLNKHIVSKIIHTPIVYGLGNWAGCRPSWSTPINPPPPPVKATPFLNREKKDKTLKQDFTLMLFRVVFFSMFVIHIQSLTYDQISQWCTVTSDSPHCFSKKKKVVDKVDKVILNVFVETASVMSYWPS